MQTSEHYDGDDYNDRHEAIQPLWKGIFGAAVLTVAIAGLLTSLGWLAAAIYLI